MVVLGVVEFDNSIVFETGLVESKTRETMVQEIINDDSEGEAEGSHDRNVTLIVGPKGSEKKFVLNRALLLLTSKPFAALAMKENKTEGPHCDKGAGDFQGKTKNKGMDLKSVDVEAFEEIVQYVYLVPKWQVTDDMVKACTLLKTAQMFELEELVELIYDEISKFLDPSLLQEHTACKILNVFEMLSLDEKNLRSVALDYICKNAAATLNSKYSKNLTLDALLDILQRDDLAVESELHVFLLVVDWATKHLEGMGRPCNLKNLRSVLRKPLRHIRFQNMTESEFRMYVQPTGIVKKELEKDLINWWDAAKCNRQLSPSEVTFKPQPRTYAARNSSIIQDSSELMNFLEKTRAELFQTRFKAELDAANYRTALEELRAENEAIKGLQEKDRRAREELEGLCSTLGKEIKTIKEEIQGLKLKTVTQVPGLGGFPQPVPVATPQFHFGGTQYQPCVTMSGGIPGSPYSFNAGRFRFGGQ